MELLVKRAIKGDKEALLKLIMAEKDNYYRLALSYMRNNDDAMDMLQEMIVVLYKEIGKLKKVDSFYSWSKTILVNLCKKNISKKVLVLEESADEVDLADHANDVNNKLYLDSLIQNLNEQQKEAITLRYYLDYSYDEISNVTGVPLGTVKSRISKGLNKLKKVVGGEKHEWFWK